MLHAACPTATMTTMATTTTTTMMMIMNSVFIFSFLCEISCFQVLGPCIWAYIHSYMGYKTADNIKVKKMIPYDAENIELADS